MEIEQEREANNDGKCHFNSRRRSNDDVIPQGFSERFDDDGWLKRTGTVLTASAHIITALIGSEVLSLPWATAQLGWIAGPVVILLFCYVTYYTSTLLSACYRSGDKRNYTYTDAVRSHLGEVKFKLCGVIQYSHLFGVAILYTIAASASMMAIERSNCFHESGRKNPCHVNRNPYMIAFGVTEIILSQIPHFDRLWWLSIVAAAMSFTYSSVGLGFGIAKVAGNSAEVLTGISIGTVTHTQKIWKSFHALGNIAFSYNYSGILFEIQDTIKSPPSEAKTMRKATQLCVTVTTLFYLLCGCVGYAALGDLAPGNLLTGFGFYNPYWLLDIANAAIVIHLIGADQVYCHPLFAFIEKIVTARFPENQFVTKEITVPIPGFRPYKLDLFRLVWRTLFVIATTIISMLIPFVNDVVGILGALGFWPLTVYFPVEMYIEREKIPKWSTRWLCLQTRSVACLIISIAAASGSISGFVHHLKTYKPFKTSY